METHRTSPEPEARRRSTRSRRKDAEPLDSIWLEREAVRYVARWESSRRGVEAVLDRKVRQRCDRTGESPDEALSRVPEIVEALVDRGYVDDRRFATQLLERLRREGRSRAQIRFQLHRKGVPDSLTLELTRSADPEDELADELSAAWRMARRRALGPFCRDPERRAAQRERHLAALARQGFSSEIAHRVIDAETPDDAESSDASDSSDSSDSSEGPMTRPPCT